MKASPRWRRNQRAALHDRRTGGLLSTSITQVYRDGIVVAAGLRWDAATGRPIDLRSDNPFTLTPANGIAAQAMVRGDCLARLAQCRDFRHLDTAVLQQLVDVLDSAS